MGTQKRNLATGWIWVACDMACCTWIELFMPQDVTGCQSVLWMDSGAGGVDVMAGETHS